MLKENTCLPNESWYLYLEILPYHERMFFKMISLINAIYNFLWGDLVQIPLPGGSTLGISLLVMIFVPAGIYFTIRTHFLPLRMFPEMIRITLENNKSKNSDGISGLQALIVSTACRVGMRNLVGVVAAISAGGAGAVFWMWLIALLGASTAFIEATLAQIYKEKDPLYGGYRGGPAYYLHVLFASRSKRQRYSLFACLFALSGLLCWCGISQVISNSVASSFENAFHIPPLYTTIFLVAIDAIIVLRKNATVKVLDIMVPIMAACYFFLTIFIIVKNAGQLPDVSSRIFSEAFGLRQAVGGGIGAAIMNGAKRGLFRPLCGCRCGYRPSCQGGAFSGSRSIHRYTCNLHLYSDDYALSASGINRGVSRYGFTASCYGILFWRIWCCVHRTNSVFI